ncbi:MAG TPA: zinc-dependent alcohol dehydrogenase [Chthoniobacterales bacterium]
MKASVFHKPGDIRVDTVPDPTIRHPQDVILKVTSTAICGSDLHIYNGFLPQKRPMVLGHEFMGIVEDAGPEVTAVAKGDRVIIPFPIACGHCFFCQHDLPGHCEESNPEKYGPEGGLFDQKGGALFGYTDFYGGYDGGQAEYVRVPFANVGPRKAPEEFSDDQLLFLTDIFPTGYCGVKWANVQPEDTVAVFGCGPVGLMAQKVAWVFGAKRVIGIDIEDYRLAMAEKSARSETLNAEKSDVVAAIREMTGGRGADVCIDAVGLEARRSLGDKISNVFHGQAGSIKVLETAISAVRRGGQVSVLGVYGMPYDNFPLGQIFDKGIHMHFGQATVQPIIDELIDWVREGRIQLDDIITHRLPLTDAARGYEIFGKKQDNCVKVILQP